MCYTGQCSFEDHYGDCTCNGKRRKIIEKRYGCSICAIGNYPLDNPYDVDPTTVEYINNNEQNMSYIVEDFKIATTLYGHYLEGAPKFSIYNYYKPLDDSLDTVADLIIKYIKMAKEEYDELYKTSDHSVKLIIKNTEIEFECCNDKSSDYFKDISICYKSTKQVKQHRNFAFIEIPRVDKIPGSYEISETGREI